MKKTHKLQDVSDEDKTAIIDVLKQYKKCKTKLLGHIKKKLEDKLKRAVEYNNTSPNKKIRQLSNYALVDKNVVSIFTSTLTRTIEMEVDELSMNMVVVRVFYVSVLEDITLNGFEYLGERYRFFSASAGQIRTKKSVFIKQSLWDKYEKTLMCGLTIPLINKKGGIQRNKFLAYLALSNSATEAWGDFDIRKSIVIDDFATSVTGVVDYIDDVEYTVERKEMDINIEHSDGCGMMLPCVSRKNKMVRAPFVKGLLAVFDFRRFVQERCPGGNCTVYDIYGKEYDIVDDDIQVIFTKSQFKLWKYYESWEQYIEYFEKYNCEIGFCNEEEDYIKDSQINYQMLQTLHGMTKDELAVISNKSKNRVNSISRDIDTMLEALGTKKKKLSPYQEALILYPELLQDEHFKKVLREQKKSMVMDYRSGRLEINGKYLFLVPDLFAACQQWFLGEVSPCGLLHDGEVFCRVYKDVDSLVVLRAPHLYKEHAIRTNVIDEEKSKWFCTDAIYTSCHDLISKYLMFDNDGDKALVVADQTLVNCAIRHMEGVVPLYYDMKKAGPDMLDMKVIFDGMNLAYNSGKIGLISNDITKIWNQEKITDESILAVKYLCCDNNFSIDSAKTLYMPKRTVEAERIINQQTKVGLPHFFLCLRDKKKKQDQVAKLNNSTVNRLWNIIVDRRIVYPKHRLEPIDYRMMMRNPNIVIDERLTEEYYKLNCKYHFKVNNKDPEDTNIGYIAGLIKTQLSIFGYDDIEISDMLVKYSFTIQNGKGKAALWFCYGTIIVENLKANLNDSFGACCKCGKRFIQKNVFDTLCDECKEKESNVIMIECCDCGINFPYEKDKSNKPKRCMMCAEIKQRDWQRKSMKKNRQKNYM